MKKLMSLALALILVLAMAAPAMAEATDTTISVAEGDKHTYAVYQIFTGDLAGETLSNVLWGENGTGTENTAVAAEVLTALAAVKDRSDIDKMAVIEQYVDMTDDAFGTVSADAALTVSTGYYLLKDLGVWTPNTETEDETDGAYVLPDNETYSLYVVEIVGPTTIKAKNGSVESSKKVDDENDSVADDENTEAVEGEDGTNWQDSADYDIGDAVPFKLTGKVGSDYANYEHYYFAFHDKESEGLTFDANSVKVYVDSAEITNGFTVVINPTDGCTFEVVFADLKTIEAVNAGSIITVEYTSTLNDKAVIGSEGNPNTMYLEYSNNPNTDYDGKGNPDDEDTGKTPEDKVIVFTYKVVVNKVDEENAALAGAGFTLYKKNAAGEYVIVGSEIKGEELTTFEWKGLDDGDYKLAETTTPAGYNTIADIEFTITAEHDVLSDNPTLTALSGNVTSGMAEFAANVQESSLTTDVVNVKGTILPETGGIGTTIFYVAGGLLMVGALVLLITKRKVESK